MDEGSERMWKNASWNLPGEIEEMHDNPQS
jgi:hypothetical protein